MRKFLFIAMAVVATAIAFTFTSCDKDDDDDINIIGKWEIIEEVGQYYYNGEYVTTTVEDVGSIVTFYNNGTYTEINKNKNKNIESTWSLNGNVLIVGTITYKIANYTGSTMEVYVDWGGIRAKSKLKRIS